MVGVMDAPTPRVVHDWPAYLKEFEAKISKVSSFTLREYADQKSLNYELCSRRFTELRNSRAETYLQRAKAKLMELAPKAVDRLGALTDSVDENVATRATLGLLDRVGLSAPVAQLQMIQQNQNNIVIPSLMSTGHSEDIGGMFGKTVDVEPVDED